VITVRYFAGARAAAGVAEDQLPPGCTLDQLAATLAARRGARLGTVFGAASFLVDGVAWRDRSRPLPDPAVVDVLPPFAGG
jgi:molybdopterin converting factor small subunit